MIRLFETARTRMRTFLAHSSWIASAFPTLPETMAAFAYQHGVASTAVLRPEVLFSGALSNVSNIPSYGILNGTIAKGEDAPPSTLSRRSSGPYAYSSHLMHVSTVM